VENGQIMIGEKARLLAVIAWLLLLLAIGVSEGAAMGQRQSNGYAQGPTAQIKGTVDRTIRILSDPNLQGDGKKICVTNSPGRQSCLVLISMRWRSAPSDHTGGV